MFGWKKRELAEQLGAAVRENIERDGQHIMSVAADETGRPHANDFAYTVGNHEAGMPELPIVGEIAHSFAPLLNRLGKMQRDRRSGFRDGEVVSLGGKYPVFMVDAGEAGRAQCALFVGSFYGTRDFALLQELFPDPNGRWPGDPQCAEGFLLSVSFFSAYHEGNSELICNENITQASNGFPKDFFVYFRELNANNNRRTARLCSILPTTSTIVLIEKGGQRNANA